MNLLKLDIHCSAHTTSPLLCCYQKTGPVPRTSGLLRTSEGRTSDLLWKSGILYQRNQSHITRTSGSLRTSEARMSGQVPEIRKPAPVEVEFYISEIRLPPDVRAPDVRHPSEIRNLPPVGIVLYNTDFRATPDVRMLMNSNMFRHIYRPRTTDPCRTSGR